MSKRRGTIFTRAVRDSNPDGTAKTHTHAIEHTRVLGLGKVILAHGRIHARSTNGRLSFTAFESSSNVAAPREDGFPLTITGNYNLLTSVGAFRFVISADSMANIEIVAKVDAAAGATTETVEFSLDTTVIEA